MARCELVAGDGEGECPPWLRQIGWCSLVDWTMYCDPVSLHPRSNPAALFDPKPSTAGGIRTSATGAQPASTAEHPSLSAPAPSLRVSDGRWHPSVLAAFGRCARLGEVVTLRRGSPDVLAGQSADSVRD